MAEVRLEVDLVLALGAGVLLPRTTGVHYRTQACGTACLQPEIEGVYLPFDGDIGSLEAELRSRFPEGSCGELSSADVDAIDEALRRVDGLAPQVFVDRSRLAESFEAWVWVTIAPSDDALAWLRFSGPTLSGVLTWRNSD